MAPGDVPDGIDHRQENEPEGQRDAEISDLRPGDHRSSRPRSAPAQRCRIVQQRTSSSDLQPCAFISMFAGGHPEASPPRAMSTGEGVVCALCRGDASGRNSTRNNDNRFCMDASVCLMLHAGYIINPRLRRQPPSGEAEEGQRPGIPCGSRDWRGRERGHAASGHAVRCPALQSPLIHSFPGRSPVVATAVVGLPPESPRPRAAAAPPRAEPGVCRCRKRRTNGRRARPAGLLRRRRPVPFQRLPADAGTVNRTAALPATGPGETGCLRPSRPRETRRGRSRPGCRSRGAWTP